VPVTIELAADIPMSAHAGTPLRFTVLQDVLVGNDVVISKGAAVTGQVVGEAKKKALVLESKMTFEVQQVDAVGGQTLKVRATPAATSSKRAVDSGTNAGAKKKPKDIAAAAGTQFVVYIDGNQSISVGK
jgi:hypothetical protein